MYRMGCTERFNFKLAALSLGRVQETSRRVSLRLRTRVSQWRTVLCCRACSVWNSLSNPMVPFRCREHLDGNLQTNAVGDQLCKIRRFANGYHNDVELEQCRTNHPHVQVRTPENMKQFAVRCDRPPDVQQGDTCTLTLLMQRSLARILHCNLQLHPYKTHLTQELST